MTNQLPIAASGRPRSALGLLLLAYVAAVVYATLYPWSGWRTPGRWMIAFLSDPWPRWWTGFDVTANIAAYFPIGLLLCARLARRRARGALGAAVVATLGAAALSLALECLQALLPDRVPSRLDLLANAIGGAAGAVLAAAIGSERIERGPHWLHTALPLAPHATPVLVLLCAWLVAQWLPQPVVFATGELLSGWPGPSGSEAQAWLSQWRLPREFEPFAEAAGVSATVLAIGLLAHELLRPGAAGAARLVVAAPLVAAIAIKTTASAAYLGRAHALGWLTAGAQGGLLAGVVALSLLGWLSPRARLWVTIAALAGATVLFNLAPPNAYYLSVRTSSGGGAWTNFHALLRGLAAVWPFVAVAWCASRLRFARRGAIYN